MSIPGPPNAIQDLIDVKQKSLLPDEANMIYMIRWSSSQDQNVIIGTEHWAGWQKVRGGKGASEIAEDLIDSEDPKLHLLRFTTT